MCRRFIKTHNVEGATGRQIGLGQCPLGTANKMTLCEIKIILKRLFNLKLEALRLRFISTKATDIPNSAIILATGTSEKSRDTASILTRRRPHDD